MILHLLKCCCAALAERWELPAVLPLPCSFLPVSAVGLACPRRNRSAWYGWRNPSYGFLPFNQPGG